MEEKNSFYKWVFKYRVLATWKLIVITVGVGILYYFFLKAGGHELFGKMPNEMVKAIRFVAFLMAAYLLFQSIGAERYKDDLIAQASMDNKDGKKRKEANVQIKLLAGEKERVKIFSVLAFVLLALLALVGQI